MPCLPYALFALCPMPYAPCPMPNSQCPIPNSQLESLTNPKVNLIVPAVVDTVIDPDRP
jgi:hypothetical protein